jgi:hypothetical protein
MQKGEDVSSSLHSSWKNTKQLTQVCYHYSFTQSSKITINAESSIKHTEGYYFFCVAATMPTTRTYRILTRTEFTMILI